MDEYSVYDNALRGFFFALSYWWVYAPFILFFVLHELYQSYTTKKYLMGLKWVLLEVTPPPEVYRSPKIAENFFAALHGIYSKPLSPKEKFFQGKVQDWLAFEIVSNGGMMQFFIRCPDGLRNIVETQLFAQYPDAEIKLAEEDYVDQLPEKLPNDEYDLFGAELIYTKENAYPIKTYEDFDEEGDKDEPKRTDPLAPLAEIMSVIGPGEHLWLQLLARPTNDEWVKKEAQPIIDKIIGKEAKKPADDFLGKGIKVIDSLLPGGASAEKKDEKKDIDPNKLTQVQKNILEKVEEKAGKLAYEAGHRFMYVGKKDVFNKARISSVIGMFKQLYANNLNSFKPNGDNATTDKGWFPMFFPSDKGFGAAEREYEKKVDMYDRYKKRKFVKKHNILSTEEMATLYHLPPTTVRAPGVPRVDARKTQPPAGLPTR